MPHPDRRRAAEAACQALTEREVVDVLGLLCSERPEALLAAVEQLRRHQATVRQLRSSSPPSDALPFAR